MKKIFRIMIRIFIALVFILLIAVFALPFFFKDEIKDRVLKEVNKNMKAELSIEDFGLTIIKTFPDFNVELENVVLVGKEVFAKDTLIKSENIDLRVDLLSVFQGQKYKVEAVNLENSKINLKVLADGRANWDIMLPDSAVAEKDTSSGFHLELEKLVLKNTDINYDDASLGFKMRMQDLNHTLKGEIKDNIADLKTKTTTAQTTLTYQGVDYIAKAKMELLADLIFDMDKFAFTFKENMLKLNELEFGIDGFFALPDEGFDMDLKLQAKENEFKNFLSMIPAIYSKDFEKIQTKGSLALDARIHGLYSDTQLPAFEVNCKIKNGMFKYPDLPSDVRDIQVDIQVNNKTGDLDKTKVDVNLFHAVVAGDSVDLTLSMSRLITDPTIEAVMKAKINLANVRKFYPLEKGTKLSGIFNMDLSVAGKVSSLEKGQYDRFSAIGSMAIQGLNYVSPDLKDGVGIEKMSVLFAPKSISLNEMKANYKDIHMYAYGVIDNFWGYFLRNELLKGSLHFSADKINLNDFMQTETAQTEKKDSSSQPLAVIKVPKNLDLELKAKIGTLIYDKLQMNNMVGVIKVVNQKAELSQLSMGALGGKMILSGSYETSQKNPKVNFNIDLKNVNIIQTVQAFDMIKHYAPFAEKCQGNVSLAMAFDTKLDETMMPIYNTLNGSGKIASQNIKYTGINSLKKIAEITKIQQFENNQFKDVNLAFAVANGKIQVDPFNVKLDQIIGKMSGYTTLDQQLNYEIDWTVPTKIMGNQGIAYTNKLIGDFNAKTGSNLSMGDKVNMKAFLQGTITKPKVRVDIAKQLNNAASDLKAKATEELQKKKAELENKAKAEADKMKKEAEAKAKAEADRLKKEAEAKAKKEVDAAKKKAEEAAKKKAEKELNKLKKVFN